MEIALIFIESSIIFISLITTFIISESYMLLPTTSKAQWEGNPLLALIPYDSGIDKYRYWKLGITAKPGLGGKPSTIFCLSAARAPSHGQSIGNWCINFSVIRTV